MSLTVGSLFSGIGGLDLGLERAGMRVIWQSEIDPYANKVLKKHWPEVPNLGNIKDIDWQSVERPAVICGGYPCQPFSTAGNRKGEEDHRHLWPWVRQAISALRPDYAILENVRGHLSLGGTAVIADLAALGYGAEWRIVSAASVGANHRRDRIIIVAYPNNPRNRTPECGTDKNGETKKQGWHDLAQPELGGFSQDVAYSDSGRCEQCKPEAKSVQGTSCGCERNVANAAGCHGRSPESHRLQTVYGQAAELRKQSSVIRSIVDWWKTEPDVGRVANGVPNRVDRLRGLGNAVVPQVAEVIGRLVLEHYRRTEAAHD